jgi:hypothetical protein
LATIWNIWRRHNNMVQVKVGMKLYFPMVEKDCITWSFLFYRFFFIIRVFSPIQLNNNLATIPITYTITTFNTTKIYRNPEIELWQSIL